MASGVKGTLGRCKEMAMGHEGLCLSIEYATNRVKMLWRCKTGHEFLMTADGVQQGQWCPYCAGTARKSLDWCQELVAKRGGTCLETEYVNTSVKMRWCCPNKHEFLMSADSMRTGEWCPHCAGNAPHDLAWLQNLVAVHGGKCLDNEYKGMTAKYRWACQKSHEWIAKANSIQQGQWCPTCSRKHSRKELSVLAYVKTLSPDAVGSQRRLLESPKFELDIYIPSLKRAIEFDGFHWHRSEWALEHGAIDREARKDAQCKNAGIELLRINELDFDNDPEAIFRQVEQFVGQENTNATS